MKMKQGSYKAFKAMTLDVARGKRRLGKGEPRIWIEAMDNGSRAKQEVRFRSLEAGAKLLSEKNRVLLRTIVKRRPKSVSELAEMTGRAEQNVLRTLRKMSAAGIVRLGRGEGRAHQPIVTARRIHFEIDLLAENKNAQTH